MPRHVVCHVPWSDELLEWLGSPKRFLYSFFGGREMGFPGYFNVKSSLVKYDYNWPEGIRLLCRWRCIFSDSNVFGKYFTSSDPHHDMLGGGCQVRVVIKNMMGRMENLRTLISGFLGLVILVRWALVTMFLSWTTQTGCRIHRTYVSLIGSGEGRHTTHLLKCVLLLSTSQTDWKQSSDVLSDISFDILSDKSSDISSDNLSDISFDILSDIFLTYLLTFFLTNLLTLFLTYLLTFFLTHLSTCFLTYLLTFFLTYQNQNLTSTASQKKPLCKLYIYLAPRSKSNIHDNFVPVNVIALSASDRPAKRQLSPKMQNACSSTHTHTTCIRPPRQKAVESKNAKEFEVPQLHLMACANHEVRCSPLRCLRRFCIGGPAPHVVCLPFMHSILPKRGRSTKDCSALLQLLLALRIWNRPPFICHIPLVSLHDFFHDKHQIPSMCSARRLHAHVHALSTNKSQLVAPHMLNSFGNLIGSPNEDRLRTFHHNLRHGFQTKLTSLHKNKVEPTVHAAVCQISLDILSGISSDILSDISFDILSDILSDISCAILSDISPDILFDISFGILSDMSSHILSDISSHILSDISSDILSDIFLTYLLSFLRDIFPDILPDISFDILSDISSDILSDISFDILSDISSDISFWHFFWHIFWHSFWHIFCHSFWHIFWHSFWHIFRHSFWHILYLLAFFLTYLFDISPDILSDISFHILTDISFDILSDLSSDILPDISFDILSDISFDILSDISSDILSDIFLTYLLTFFLTYLLTYLSDISSGILFDISFRHIFCHSFWQVFWHNTWGPARHTELTGSRLGSGPPHWTHELAVGVRAATLNSHAVGVRHATLNSRARGWGPARHTELTGSRLRSGMPHWTHKIVVEVRHATLNSQDRSWDPTRRRTTGGGGGRRRKESTGVQEYRSTGGGEETNIKSNNPHLTGGEKEMGKRSEGDHVVGLVSPHHILQFPKDQWTLKSLASFWGPKPPPSS